MTVSNLLPLSLSTLFTIPYFNLASLILVIVIFTILTPVFGRLHRRHKLLENVPGTTNSYFIGSLTFSFIIIRALLSLKTAKDAAVWAFEALSGLPQLYAGGICKIWLGWEEVLVLYGPEQIKAVLMSTKNLRRSRHYSFIEEWSGNGILVSTGDKWKIRRKMLTPAFNFRLLEGTLPIFNEQSRILVEKLEQHLTKEYVDIVQPFTLCTLDIITEAAMGVKLKAQNNDDSPYVNVLRNVCSLFMVRIMRPWLWPDVFFSISSLGSIYEKNINKVLEYSREVINIRKNKLLKETKGVDSISKEDYESKRENFLEILLRLHKNDNCLTEEDVREEVDTFMFAGHDTTASGLSWTIYLLGLYPNIQDKLRKEVDAIFCDDPDRALTMDDLHKLKFLECVIKESHRLYPPAPFIARELEEDMMIKNYKVGAGTTCIIFPYMLHRDPKIYPNPEQFDPDRFLPENSKDRHPFAFIPFSGGPRNCIDSTKDRSFSILP
ncbi:cytochrome P450 4V2-like isoform X2 [Tachypleus tridentatus]|uniref:cytochrome P450 4V2-like isoform X2 n=1 Tax=Tachypleus tridentatus TaxID=6853 RepID=UPI003FCEF9A5